MSEKKHQRRPWRENIEALTMAIAVALLFKVFILEISRIPSGSMQPTLMGHPETETFDRILVDKLSFARRDPKRFEIVVFKHPLERSRIMVKRLVGLPDEDFKIEYGDLWARATGTEDWVLMRRPENVQAQAWRQIEPDEVRVSSWSAIEGAQDWRFHGRDVKARGPGRAGFRAGAPFIGDDYADGYPDQLRSEITAGQAWRNAVGDLQLTGELTPLAGTEWMTVELNERDRTYRFRVPGPAAPANAQAELVVQQGSQVRATESAKEGTRAVAGEALPFLCQNLDDQLTFELDGEVILSADVEALKVERSSVVLEVTGSGGEWTDLVLSRDVFYHDGGRDTWQTHIDEGHYVMLGDNTHDSADGRDWRYTKRHWNEGDNVFSERGNSRPVPAAQPNPVPVDFGDESGIVFRNEWGDRHWIRNSQLLTNVAHLGETKAPLVPRELIIGRAVAVFWPIQITRRMWRLGWLH